MNITELWFFLIASIALLGSPGPAIAALLAVGRAEGWARGLAYFTGLQVGLALAAGISIAGLFAAINLIPGSMLVMSGIAIIYLLYLSYKIATSPVQIYTGHPTIFFGSAGNLGAIGKSKGSESLICFV